MGDRRAGGDIERYGRRKSAGVAVVAQARMAGLEDEAGPGTLELGLLSDLRVGDGHEGRMGMLLEPGFHLLLLPGLLLLGLLLTLLLLLLMLLVLRLLVPMLRPQGPVQPDAILATG